MSAARFAKISAFCQTGSGTTPSRQNTQRYYGGTIPWVKSGELREADITRTEESVTEAALRETSLKVVPAGALLVAMYGATVGRVGRLAIDATTNQAICHVIPDGSVSDAQYIFHALCAKASELVARGVGGAQPNISQGIVRDTEIFLPPLDEQRRIAAILDQADALRRKRREAIGCLAVLKTQIFQSMFGDWWAPGSSVEVLELGNVLNFLTSGSRGWAKFYRETGDRFIRIQNVKRDELDLSDMAFVEAPPTAEAVRTKVQPGDVLLSITADLGRTAVVPGHIGDAYINQHLAILRTDRLVPEFLSAALASPAGQLAIQRQNREGVKAGLNFSDIRGFRVPAASRQSQEAFAARAAKVDLQVRLQRKHMAASDALFASLQHRAFRGEL